MCADIAASVAHLRLVQYDMPAMPQCEKPLMDCVGINGNSEVSLNSHSSPLRRGVSFPLFINKKTRT